MNIIELHEVSLEIRKRPLLTDVNLTVPTGEAVALVGANGSGKSLLLRLMCLLAKPTSGRVIVAKSHLASGREMPLGFGVVIDGPAAMEHRSGIDNLRYLARIRGLISDEDISRWMHEFGLDPLSRQPVRQYSQGMKQRLALAQAMMEGQDVLLLDEPFNALDRDGVSQVKTLLQQRVSDGSTLVFTSHLQGDVSELADRAYLVEGGTVRRI